jgi:hypothetical protein
VRADQRGARHCADLQGTFAGEEYATSERGDEAMTQIEPTPQAAPATAPLEDFLTWNDRMAVKRLARELPVKRWIA